MLYNVSLCWQCGRRCRQGPVSSCLRQHREDQRWMRVRLFLSTFQCAFYLPARHEHPHPVPTTQTHPALPLNITHILVTNTHPGKYAEAKIKCQLCPTKHMRLQSVHEQQKAWCIQQQITQRYAGGCRAVPFRGPSFSPHVPQCLTEVSAAWTRQGPSAGPWPPLITVCGRGLW